MSEKVFVTLENIGIFECPECRKSWTKDLSNLKNILKNNRVICNCPCGHSFRAVLERRRHPRKITNLKGAFVHDRSQRRGSIIVRNISQSGARLELSSEQFIHVGERLILKFNLDDPEGSFVHKEAIVKKIDGRDIGVEFCGFSHKNALESYLK